MLSPYKKLPKADIGCIQKYIYDYAYDGYTPSAIDLKHILRFWNSEKASYLFKMFGEELILSKDIVLKKPIEELSKEFSKGLYSNPNLSNFYNDFSNFAFNYRDPDTGIKFYSNLMSLIAPKSLSTNIYPGGTFQITSPKGKKITFQRGCKTIKALGKIAKEFNLKDFENFRLEHSRFTNQRDVTGKLCISIHPMDYMTMSDNDCGWQSCMSWMNEGCYRQGTVEMMNSDNVIVAYLKSEEDMKISDEFFWNSKKWRQLFIVDENIITGIKAYPFPNEELTEKILNWLRELVKINLNWDFEKKVINYNPWRDTEIFSPSDRRYFDFRTEYMYNDFGSTDYHQGIFPLREQSDFNFDDLHYILNYSGMNECVICGGTDNIDLDLDESLLICNNCGNFHYCESCGARLPFNSDGWFWDGDEGPLCQCCYSDLFSICEITREEVRRENLINLSLCRQDDYCDWTDRFIQVREDIENSPDWDYYFKPGAKIKNIENIYYINMKDCRETGLNLFRLNTPEKIKIYRTKKIGY